jgi:hypothetical protein
VLEDELKVLYFSLPGGQAGVVAAKNYGEKMLIREHNDGVKTLGLL